MAATVRAGPARTLGLLPALFAGAGTQKLEPVPSMFTGRLAGSWIRNGTAGISTRALMDSNATTET